MITPHNAWTWVGGSNLAGQAGVYGTAGTAAAVNIPGGRYGEASWTDSSGNFWLFGGTAAPSSTTDNYFNDLWRYSAGQWTWMGGTNQYNQAGVYGTMGTSATGNVPGGRYLGVTWTDKAGNFWLFGGLGLDSRGYGEILGDLWEYSGGQWTWMGGPKEALQNVPGVYGTQGTPAPGNIPGARDVAVSWTDKAGNFWLFGGYGYDSTGALGNLNDLWKYSGGQWTWMNGTNLANQPGVYGTVGTASATNVPSGRSEASGWVDASGDLWLFGGNDGKNGAVTTFGPLNDLWRYSAGQWTWMGGSNADGQIGTYGSLGVAAAGNTPGARVLPTTWTDSAGNLWLFGGNGRDSAQGQGDLNDLWKYSGGQWTWVGGSNLVGQAGAYGVQGKTATGNIPGARLGEPAWTDASGNVFLFGGYGVLDATQNSLYLNDVWEYQP